MNHVLFTWYAEGAGGSQSVHWTWMPTVPREKETVHVPLSPNPLDTIALTVRHVAWTNDGTAYWNDGENASATPVCADRKRTRTAAPPQSGRHATPRTRRAGAVPMRQRPLEPRTDRRQVHRQRRVFQPEREVLEVPYFVGTRDECKIKLTRRGEGENAAGNDGYGRHVG